MNTNVDDLFEKLDSLKVADVMKLVKKLETEWGVDATKVVQPLPEPINTTAIVENPAYVNLVLESIDSFGFTNKIALIKEARYSVPGLGLAEAKYLIENVPRPLKDGVLWIDKDQIINKFKSLGATVRWYPCGSYTQPVYRE